MIRYLHSNLKLTTLPIAIAVLAAAWQSMMINLASVDHRACFDNMIDRASGSNQTRIRVGDLSQLEKIQIYTNEFAAHDVILILILMIPFYPLIISAMRTDHVAKKIAYTIGSVVLAFLLYLFMGTPSNLHDCDRKGSDAALLILINPIVFLFPAIILSWISGAIANRMN